MSVYASIDGTIVPGAEARVSVLDNGFTFGDAVYETLGHRHSFVRFVVSRGVGDISYDFARVQGPTIVIVVKPFAEYPPSHHTEGIPVALVSVRRNHPSALDPAIKSCNLLNNILAVREAQAMGAIEPILLNQEGHVAEGATSNVFAVAAGRIRTPPLSAGILAGITREVVLELGLDIGLDIGEETVTPDALRRADEVFITSSLKEVAPVKSIDGRPVGAGRPGPLTLKLRLAYRDALPRLGE
jgi:branched-chain amino acid aminotransferase